MSSALVAYSLQSKVNNLPPCLPGQPQQAVSQMGRGQPGSTAVPGAVPGAAPVQTTEGQRAAGLASSPCAAATVPGQPPGASPQTTRPQQGQVKLTMAQLMQLTQGAQVRVTCRLHHYYAISFL